MPIRNLLFVFILLMTAFSPPLNAAPDKCARASIVVGRGQMNGQEIHEGDWIPKGAILKTGPSSLIKIILNDDSIIDIGEKTQFEVVRCLSESGQLDIDLSLQEGILRAVVNKTPIKPRNQFHIKTRSSVLAVRGTELFLRWEKNAQGEVEETVGVTEGQVDVQSQFNPNSSPVSVDSGKQFSVRGVIRESSNGTTVQSLDTPKVDQFNAREQKAFEKDVKIEDSVFINSLTLPDKKSDRETKSTPANDFLASLTGVKDKNTNRQPSSEIDNKTSGPNSTTNSSEEKPPFPVSDEGTNTLPPPTTGGFDSTVSGSGTSTPGSTDTGSNTISVVVSLDINFIR